MELPNFDTFQRQMQTFYQQGEYAAALDLATKGFDFYPQHRPLLYYWRIALSARIGDNQAALDLLQETLEGGIWYSETLLRKSPSLGSLQGEAVFEQLVAWNLDLQRQDQERTFPLLMLRPEGQCLAGMPPCPLFMGLHANASNAQQSVEFWRAAATAGWLVALPQSSQAMYRGAYNWDDHQIAEDEIKKHFYALLEQYSINDERVILAGHSMGAEIAIWLALKGEIQVSGFIAFGPGGPYMDDLEEWRSLISDHVPEGLRGYIIVGEEEDILSQEASIPHGKIPQLVDMLNAAGVACKYEEVPLAEHSFDPAYETSLLRALAFIDQGLNSIGI